jgi:hypothetical protein
MKDKTDIKSFSGSAQTKRNSEFIKEVLALGLTALIVSGILYSINHIFFAVNSNLSFYSLIFAGLGLGFIIPILGAYAYAIFICYVWSPQK